MPAIQLEFDGARVPEADARSLSEAIQKIVSEVTGIEDVFVYGNSALIQVRTAPIEIFVKMSAHKINDVAELLDALKTRLASWKQEQSFPHSINLTLTPMPWKFEIGI